jgi:hypothetical protein
MKKFVVLSSISFLILAFGATVYGQGKAPALEFKASGFIDVITEYLRNVPQPRSTTSTAGVTSIDNVVYSPPIGYMMPGNNQAFDKKMAYMENRGRLKFDAIMGKEMMGTFFFEIDSTRWGERIPAGSTSQSNFAGFWGVADRAAVEVKNMFITAGMPWIPVPVTVQAGIIPMAIRVPAFLATDGPGITAAVKVDPATIRLIWMKALENKDWAADDADLYGIEASAKISTMTVGGYALNFNMNSYPVGDGEPNYASNVWWYGIYADGKLGPVNLSADLVFDNGKITDRRPTPPARDVKLSGWGGILNVSYPWEKFNFGFASIYGSGADQKKTSATALPGGTTPWGTTSTKAEAFIIPAGTEGSYGHSLILCGNGINRMNTGFEPAAKTAHARAAFGGLWINKLYGSFMVTPQFKTTIEGMYIRDTTDNGNTIGNALKTNGRPRDDSDIGWEIDWLNTLSISKNITFGFGGGILFAGDAMDYAVAGAAAGTNKGPKNPWVITTNLTYSF